MVSNKTAPRSSGRAAKSPPAKQAVRTAATPRSRHIAAPPADTRPGLSGAADAQRAGQVLDLLAASYPVHTTALTWRSPLQLLVATILSAQCTDERVNQVTPLLFERFPAAADLAHAAPEELERIVHSTGFFRAKARSIQGAAQAILRDHAGEVPRTMEQLVALPGVARKTANVVLGTAFGIAEGVVVDTHVKRLSGRLGFTRHSDPVKIERDLMQLAPRGRWIDLGHLLILHGRAVCKARRPPCVACQVAHLCPSAVVA